MRFGLDFRIFRAEKQGIYHRNGCLCSARVTSFAWIGPKFLMRFWIADFCVIQSVPLMFKALVFATVYYASPCGLWTQVCFSKSSCATRLKVSAATVLSRRGAVIPHVQWEQHQPLKSSPSIQIRCLFIHLPLRACWD